MFSFSPHKRKEIAFVSNPPITETYKVVADEREGKVFNKVISVPSTNESLLSGLHFSRESMSLRAKLNLGLPLTFVSNPNVGDFASAFNSAQKFERDVTEKINSFSDPNSVNYVAPSIPESSKSE